MTIEPDAPFPAPPEPHVEIVRFVFRAARATGLLANARVMLDAAPRELAESFEQAVRRAGIAS